MRRNSNYRQRHPAIEIDMYITEVILHMSRPALRNAFFMRSLKYIEHSCNGLLWLVCILLSIWLFWIKSLFQIQVNLLLGLIVDIVVVAIIKATVQRKRPFTSQPGAFEFGPDKFSFPSGHVSRAFFILFFCTCTHDCGLLVSYLVIIWSFLVAYSRILLKRHFILDVIAGLFLGLIEGWFMSYLTISKDLSFYIISYLTDEPYEGSEYHV